MLLQTIIGAWPLDLDANDQLARRPSRNELAGWQQKALREAKLGSDWSAVPITIQISARHLTWRDRGQCQLPDLLTRIVAFANRIVPPARSTGWRRLC